MPVSPTDARMADKGKKKPPKGRVEFQAPQSWIDRAERVAGKLGLSLSAYIRLTVGQDMDRREAEKGRQGKNNED